MTELYDAAQLHDDPAHWDALAERVATNAMRQTKTSAFAWLADSRGGWIAACVFMAAAIAFTIAPATHRRTTDWKQALAPADDVGKAIVVHDGPPAIGGLLSLPSMAAAK